jgi:hypothetical protein
MSESKKLTKRQLAVLEDLFTGELDEQAVLDKHAVPRCLYERWLADERFTEQIERRIAHAYCQSRMILARYAPTAAVRLVELTDCEKEETARKACLDIISLQWPASHNAPSDAPPASQAPAPAPDLSPETASRLLAALAEQA